MQSSGNSIHSSSDESEHEADDYDDDEEDDRQEKNLLYDTLIYFDNYFHANNFIPFSHTLQVEMTIASLCWLLITESSRKKPEDEIYYRHFQFVWQYVSSEANAGESATLIYIHSFIHERTVLTKSQYNGYIKQLPILFHLFITICIHTYIVTYIHTYSQFECDARAGRQRMSLISEGSANR